MSKSDLLSINLKELIGQLPQDTLGVFEPASGLMYLNVNDETFDAWRASASDADDLSHVFHHELYHFIQTIATGYQFSLTLAFYEAFSRDFTSYRESLTVGWHMLMAKAAFWRSPEERAYRLASAVSRARVDRLLNLPRDRDTEDLSMAGAFYPRLFKKLEALYSKQAQVSESGLSAGDVIEGAAVGYELLVRHRSADEATTEFLARAHTDHPEYVPAFAVIAAIRTDRPAELLLAASALALRFENPNDVLESIARIIALAPPGVEGGEARALQTGGALRELRGGRYYGTAVDVRRRLRPSYRLYDKQLDALRGREWGVDEIGLLTARNPLRVLPPGKLGLAIVTRESIRGVSKGEGSARLTIAATLLRHHSLRSYARRVGLEMRDLLLGGLGD